MNRKILIFFMACTAVAAFADVTLYGGAGPAVILEKIEHIGPHRYQGPLLNSQLGFTSETVHLLWNIGCSFTIGELHRAEPDTELTVIYSDPVTGDFVTKKQLTNHPLRLKASLYSSLFYRLPLESDISVDIGGELKYRFEMSMFRDYPVFIGSLDLGPALHAAFPVGRNVLSAELSAPLVSAYNDLPYTGTNGWIIENIFSDPLKVVIKHQLGTFLHRPLARIKMDFTMPLSKHLSLTAGGAAELFLLDTYRKWSELSLESIVSIGYTF